MSLWKTLRDNHRRGRARQQDWIRKHPWGVRIFCILQGSLLGGVGAAGLVLVAYERPEEEFWLIILAAGIWCVAGIGMIVFGFWQTRKSAIESPDGRPREYLE